MKRKLFAALMALAAFVAFGVAATSASATKITHPTGTLMSVHASPTKTCVEEPTGCILATNIGETVMTDLNTNKLIRCTAAEMTGYLVTNGPNTVTGNITANHFTGTGTAGDCTSSTGASIKVTTSIAGGLPYCMKTVAEKDEVEIRGGLCSEGTRSIKFTLDATGVGSCGYEIASLKGTFTTHSTGDAIVTLDHAGNFKRYESEGLVSLFCPAESTLDMVFTMETDTKVASDPIYISP
jgi:hypothetical protein